MVEAGANNPRESSWNIARLVAKHLAVANADAHSPIRRSHASIAASCFAALFLAETGINLAQLLTMKWSPELKILKIWLKSFKRQRPAFHFEEMPF